MRGDAPPKPPAASKRFVLPPEVPAEIWHDWDAHRRGKGWSLKAKELAARNFVQLIEDGYDLRHCVDHAIESGWKKVFPREVPADRKTQSDDFMRGAK